MSATRIIGLIVLIVGALALIGGLGYMLKAYLDQDENNDGFFTNPEEGQENKDQFYQGAWTAGGGLLLVVVGIVVMRAGSSPRAA